VPGLLDASWQRLVAAAAETDQQARRLLHIQAAMDGVDVAAGSADGAVRVSVDRNGALTDISFAEGAMRLGPAGLAAAVMDAIREARTRIGPRYAEIVRSSGADEATADRMIGRYQENHPDRFFPDRVEAPPEQLRTKAATVEDDEDQPMPLLRRATNRPG
jgi:DNA-binding protein YbaB